MSHVLKGWAGVSAHGYITGWCLYSDNYATPLEVEFLVDGETLGTAVADDFRQHLLDRGVGTGFHGFRIKPSKDYPPEKLMTGVVRLKGAPDQTVALSNKLVGSAPAPTQTSQPAPVPAASNASTPQPQKSARLTGAGKAVLAQIENALLARRLPIPERWPQLSNSGTFLAGNKEFHALLLSIGRGCLYEKDLSKAYMFFNMLISLSEDDPEPEFFLGVTYLQDGQLEQARSIFLKLYNSGWKPERSGLELAKVGARQINAAGHAQDQALSADLLALLNALLDLDPLPKLPASLAQAATQIGDLDLAERIIEISIAQNPDRPEPLVAKTRILIEMRKIDEAMELSDLILERWPGNLTATNNKRVYGYLQGALKPLPEPGFIQVTRPDEPDSPLLHGDQSRFENCATLGALFTHDVGKEDILVLGPTAEHNYDTWRKLVMRHPQAGCIIDEDGTRLWRAKALQDLDLAGLIELEKPLNVQLGAYEWVYTPKTPTPGSGPVVLLSRYGIAKFGGAEHTMESLAYNYKSFGLEPHILGVEREAIESHVKPEGIVSGAIDNDPNVMRRYFIKNRASVVHAISGMGYQVAQALEMTNITFVYGIYFWRDVLGRGGGETFFEGDGTPIPREDFGYIMSQAQTIFANSEYTRDIIEAAHGIRCPVIPSIPGERA